MASPKIAVDIRDYIVNTLSIADVSIGLMSPLPINQYAVIEYMGGNIKTHGGGTGVLDWARLQIQARHATARTALTRIQALVDALDGLKDTTINSVLYTYITEQSRPRILEQAEDGSVTYYWECEVQCRRA